MDISQHRVLLPAPWVQLPVGGVCSPCPMELESAFVSFLVWFASQNFFSSYFCFYFLKSLLWKVLHRPPPSTINPFLHRPSSSLAPSPFFSSSTRSVSYPQLAPSWWGSTFSSGHTPMLSPIVCFQGVRRAFPRRGCGVWGTGWFPVP